MAGRRATDPPQGWRHRVAITYARWGRDVTTMIAVGIAAISVYLIVQEREKRADQLCTISERKQARDIDQLRQLYAYLERQAAKGALGKGFNPDIVRSLPRAEEDARFDDAPAFCDEPGVGLREPDPRLPRRPRVLASAVENARF